MRDGAVTLPQRDLRLLVEAAGRCADADGLGLAVPDLLDALTALVPCDVAFWNWYSLRAGMDEHALVGAPSGRDPVRAPLGPWLEHLSEHPIMSGRHGPVVCVSDVFDTRALESSWLYQEAWSLEGIEYEIGLELRHGPDEMNVVVLSRGQGRDFTERDHLVLRLLRPHVDAAIARLGPSRPPLTRREREVLRLVGAGLTDSQVGQRLRVATATVSKHLQNVYAKVGARSRLHAIALCRSELDLPAIPPAPARR